MERLDCLSLMSSFFHLRQRRLGLRQPEGHPHVAIESDGGGQGSAGLLPLAMRNIQRAQSVVAVRLEWAHAQFLSQGEGLAVVTGGGLALWGCLARRTLAQEP